MKKTEMNAFQLNPGCLIGPIGILIMFFLITLPYNRVVFHPQQIILSNQKLALQISLSWRPPPSVFDRIDREPATPVVQAGPKKKHRYKLGYKPIQTTLWMGNWGYKLL